MDFPITSILIAGAMPWICTGIAKAGQKNYDNHNRANNNHNSSSSSTTTTTNNNNNKQRQPNQQRQHARRRADLVLAVQEFNDRGAARDVVVTLDHRDLHAARVRRAEHTSLRGRLHRQVWPVLGESTLLLPQEQG